MTGYGQQNAAAPAASYNGDYYSVMPVTPHDYLGNNDMLPSTNANVLGHNNPTAVPVMSGSDVSSKLPGTGATTNGIKMVEQGIQNLGLGVTSIAADPSKQQVQQNVAMPLAGVSVGGSTGNSQNVILPGSSMPVQMGQNAAGNNGSNTIPGSNAPKPVSWAAIASKPAKPQPKSKAKAATGQALPPPIRHNMDIGTWDNAIPQVNKGPVRGTMPEQQNVPQRWSAPRQGGNGQRYGLVI